MCFPVFDLPGDEITYEDGLVLYENNLVIDDRNRKEKTLGSRRLHILEPLLPLKKAYIDPISLIYSGKRYFIDNLGKVFEYQKTKFEQIKYHKIIKIIDRETVSLIKCAGIDTLIPVRRPPPEWATWAGILYIGEFPWYVVLYSDKQEKASRKKI